MSALRSFVALAAALCALVTSRTTWAQWLPSSSRDEAPPPPAMLGPATTTITLPFVGPASRLIVVPPFATIELATCRLPGASHNGDTVVTIAPEGPTVGATNDDATGCGTGSFAEWTAGARETEVELRVRCYSGGTNCSGTLAWRIRLPVSEEPHALDAAHPLSLSFFLEHARTLRVESAQQRGAVEFVVSNQEGQVLERRRLDSAGHIELSMPFEPRAEYTLAGRCADGHCAATVRASIRPNARHEATKWELFVSARAAIGGSLGGPAALAFGGAGDAHVYARFAPIALRVEAPTTGAVWSPNGGVFFSGVRGLVGYSLVGLDIGAGAGAITLNRRIGGIRERVWPEALLWLRFGNAAASLDLVFGGTFGVRAQPWLSLARAHLWARVGRTVDLGVLGEYSIHGALRVDGALRHWVRGRGVDPGAWAIFGTLGFGEFFYQPQCPLGPCSDALAYRAFTIGLGITWRP